MTFSVTCRYCRSNVLEDLARIEERHVTMMREHVLGCQHAPTIANRDEIASLSLDRLRDLGVLLKHFDVSTGRK